MSETKAQEQQNRQPGTRHSSQAVPPGHLKCNVLPKPRASDAICFKALRKREMQRTRAQPTVDSDVSLELDRFDTSKLCDSHAIVMRKELRGAALPDQKCRALGRKRKLGDCDVTGHRGLFRVDATKSKRWPLLERLSAVPCSEPHSPRSPGDRWSELSSHTAVGHAPQRISGSPRPVAAYIAPHKLC